MNTYPGMPITREQASTLSDDTLFRDADGDPFAFEELDNYRFREPLTVIWDPAWNERLILTADDPRIKKGATLKVCGQPHSFVIDERIIQSSAIRHSILNESGYYAVMVAEAPVEVDPVEEARAELWNSLALSFERASDVISVIQKLGWEKVIK